MDKWRQSPNKMISNNSASNLALNDYFSDLVAPQENHINAPNVNIDDEYALKLSDAERLLKKAQSLSELMDDESFIADEIDRELEVKLEVKHELKYEVEHLLNEPSKASVVLKNTHVSDNNLSAINHQEKPELAETEDVLGVRDAQISLQQHLDEHFHVLLCEVAGLTIAIPLVELGGIHKITKISPLVGKPAWFMGLLIKGSNKYQCIDTARCIMPEKYTATLASELDYKFAVQLGKSPYVLCCEKISTTITLGKEDIKWRADSSKRPWLAGLLKEKMCALIDGARMVQVVLGK